MAVKEIAIFMHAYDRVVICAHKYHSVSSCLRTWHVYQVCKLVELEHRQWNHCEKSRTWHSATGKIATECCQCKLSKDKMTKRIEQVLTKIFAKVWGKSQMTEVSSKFAYSTLKTSRDRSNNISPESYRWQLSNDRKSERNHPVVMEKWGTEWWLRLVMWNRDVAIRRRVCHR